MLSAARAKAEALDAKVVIAIVDAGGGLIGYLRMPGAFLVSNDLATDKAWTAASFAASTRDVGALLNGEEPQVREGLLKRPRMTIVSGGVPLMVDGRYVGGVEFLVGVRWTMRRLRGWGLVAVRVALSTAIVLNLTL